MLYRIWPLLKEVYHYEKHSTLDSDYLRQVLTLAVVVLFALNFSCNGLDKPVVFVLTGLTSLVLLMVEWLLPRAKNEKHLVMFSNTALIFIGLLLLVWNENDGFQNLWFFLMPATLFVQSGLPIGLPFCTAGISASGRLRCQLPPRAVRRQRLPRRAERRAAAGDGLDHQRRRCAGRHGLRPVLPRPLRQGLHHRRVPEIERDAVRACGGQGRGGAAGKRRDSGAVTRQKDVL